MYLLCDADYVINHNIPNVDQVKVHESMNCRKWRSLVK